MEKTIEVEGRKIKIRGLRRKEVKQLRSECPDGGEKEIEMTFDLVDIKEKDIEDLYNANVLKIYREIMALTFPTPDQLKN